MLFFRKSEQSQAQRTMQKRTEILLLLQPKVKPTQMISLLLVPVRRRRRRDQISEEVAMPKQKKSANKTGTECPPEAQAHSQTPMPDPPFRLSAGRTKNTRTKKRSTSRSRLPPVPTTSKAIRTHVPVATPVSPILPRPRPAREEMRLLSAAREEMGLLPPHRRHWRPHPRQVKYHPRCLVPL